MTLGSGPKAGLRYGALAGLAIGLFGLTLYVIKASTSEPGAESGGFAGFVFLTSILSFPSSLVSLRLGPLVGYSNFVWIPLLVLTPVVNWGLIGLVLGGLSDLLRPGK